MANATSTLSNADRHRITARRLRRVVEDCQEIARVQDGLEFTEGVQTLAAEALLMADQAERYSQLAARQGA